MPCGDGGVPYGYLDNVPKKEMNSIVERLDDVTSLLCKLCTSLEEDNQSRFLEDPEINRWWESHKEADRKRAIEEKEKYEAALADAKLAHRRRKEYFKYLIDPNLDQMDKSYFSKRMTAMTQVIVEHINNFPEIENHVSRFMPKKGQEDTQP